MCRGSPVDVRALEGATTTTRTAEGSVRTTTEAPDPRFGMISHFIGTAIMTAGGRQSVMTSSRTVVPDPNNPLALASLTQTFSVDGRQWSSVDSGATRQTTMTTPSGRITTMLFDANGCLSSVAPPGIARPSWRTGRLASCPARRTTIRIAYWRTATPPTPTPPPPRARACRAAEPRNELRLRRALSGLVTAPAARGCRPTGLAAA